MTFAGKVSSSRSKSLTTALTSLIQFSCRGKFDSKRVPLNAWVYYVAAIVYDVGVTVISVGYLLKHKHTSISHTMYV